MDKLKTAVFKITHKERSALQECNPELYAYLVELWECGHDL